MGRPASLLIVLLAFLGVTILRIGQVVSVHLFVGLLLLGPVAIKMASSSYRFVRYYTGNAAYRKKGHQSRPCACSRRSSYSQPVVVFVNGVLLMFAGPAGEVSFS